MKLFFQKDMDIKKFPMDVHTTLFLENRPLLFSMGYKFLGSITDTEDLLQDVFLMWYAVDVEAIEQPKSYLCRMVVNASYQKLKILKVTRPMYSGPWLPEPDVIFQDDPAFQLDRPKELSMGMLFLLEKLTPGERTVYLLREIFDWEYLAIGEIVKKSDAACRQLLHRAKEKLQSGPPKYKAGDKEVTQLTQAFLMGTQEGNLQPLLDLLEEKVHLYSDGGGKVSAATKPLHGKERCAKFILGIANLVPENVAYRLAKINGELGIIAYQGSQPYSAMVFQWANGGINRIFIIRNPDKLQHLVKE